MVGMCFIFIWILDFRLLLCFRLSLVYLTKMPSFCVVSECGKRAERDKVRFFRIPSALKDRGIKLDEISKKRREAWTKSLKRGDLSETFLKNARICSDHFVTGEPARLEDTEHPDWVPTQNMGYEKREKPNTRSVERHERTVERAKKRKMLYENIASTSQCNADFPEVALENVEVTPDVETRSIEVQTDWDMEYMLKLSEDMTFSTEKIALLSEKLKSMELTENSFVNNDQKALYFTGFPTADMMLTVFKYVKNYLSTKSVLSPFQQFLLTLMRLRINLPFKYLGYRFSISPKTVSRIFYNCIDIFYDRFKRLVIWPRREILRGNMPQCFKENFRDKVAVIIDCFEIFTEYPSGLINAANCWSNYKHHETIKFLIGITPQGTISYISEAWGGRTSDKYLTENCGFFNLIQPGDVILADRGFLIEDSVKILGAQLNIPAFTKGKKQLHPVDIESTRNIANVRIHVERVIGLLRKKFMLLRGPIPISMLCINRDDLSAMDKILTVCSAFVNLCPSQIPME